jgi:hypothetical protein
MKFVSTDGRFHAYDFPEDVAVSPERVMAMLEHHVREDDRIDSLCVDFCGVFVPVAHRAELRIMCALVCTYARTHEARFNEVSRLGPPRVRACARVRGAGQFCRPQSARSRLPA